DTRGFHYIQGGYFQKGFDKHGALSNPFTFGYFLPMAHHKAPRFTHTFVIYEGAALPEQYRGQLFGVFPLQSQVVRSVVETDRASFKTHDLPALLTTTDSWCRPVDIQVGPDGAMYVADLYEQRIDHSSHYQGRVDRSTGRIYRIRAKDAKHAAPFDLAKLSSPELIELLKHENKWHRQTALRLLADRRDASIVPELRRVLEASTGQTALEALWAIHLSGGLSNELALRTLDHSDPFVRLWTVRLLCDERSVAPPVALKLAELAGHEPNLEARVQLACSARRLPVADSLPIVRRLLARDEDVADIYQPLSIWWAIEAHANEHRDQVLAMFSDRAVWELPLVQEHILPRLMRRYAATGARKDLLTCARLLELAPTQEHAKRLMTGFEQAFEGRPLSGLPDELLTAMAKAGGGSLALRVRQKETAAIDEALALVADEKQPVAERTLHLQVLGDINEPRSVPVMLKVVEQSSDDTVRAAALTALQSYDGPQIAEAVIGVHNALSDDLRLVAQTLLASRRAWSLALLQAIDSKRVDAALVPQTIVRKLLFHRDDQIASLVRQHFGEIQGATTEAMREQIDRLVGTVYAGSGNPYDGAKLFSQTCAKCHVLFGDGGSIGPDLTGYNRQDLPIMLLNVVNPSASIREGFENYVAVTTDGRTLNGFVADQDGRTVVLRGIDGQNIILPREEIEELAAIPQSIMPEGILTPLNEQQVRDLFAFLRMSQPLPGTRVQPPRQRRAN
ncbi:MAG: c-type cytochrome, partial [Planctomycetes bacterium]|nr:c-type cytochrome [Planctomycetota bacterium]